MTPARFRWGLAFIQFGIFILLMNMDILHEGMIEDLLVFFPFVLIAVGIEKLCTKTRVHFLAYVTSIALFAGGFLIAFTSSATSGFYDDFFTESSYRLENEDGVKRIQAVLNLDRTDLKIRNSGSDLVYARFNEFVRKPEIETEFVDDDLMLITMNARKGSFLGGIVKIENDGDDNDWYLRFSEDKPLDLECYGEESSIHLNLANTPLEKLLLDASDAELYVKIGDIIPNVTIVIQGEESCLKIRVPETSGLKVKGEDKRDYLLLKGFDETDDGYYINAGYDSTEFRIDLDVDDRIGCFTLEFF